MSEKCNLQKIFFYVKSQNQIVLMIINIRIRINQKYSKPKGYFGIYLKHHIFKLKQPVQKMISIESPVF